MQKRHPGGVALKENGGGREKGSPPHEDIEGARSNFEKGKESEVAQSSLTLRPHGLQPPRLLRPWDFPGKNTGVGCQFLQIAVRRKGNPYPLPSQ